MKLLNKFLVKYPQYQEKYHDLRDQYVNFGIVAMNYATILQKIFMQHLLEIKGLDSSELSKEELRVEFFNLLNKKHADPFEEDFEFSKYYKPAFDKVKEKFPSLELTTERFLNIVSLENLSNKDVLKNTVREALDVISKYSDRLSNTSSNMKSSYLEVMMTKYQDKLKTNVKRDENNDLIKTPSLEKGKIIRSPKN